MSDDAHARIEAEGRAALVRQARANNTAMLIGTDGAVLSENNAQVRREMEAILEDGEIVLVVVETDDGLALQGFGPPSVALAEVLEQGARAVRAALARRG